MCPPTYFPALPAHRCWTPGSAALNVPLAIRQWESLVRLVEHHVAPVELLRPEPWTPAMAFTRELGITAIDDAIAPLVAHSNRGAFEAPLAQKAFAAAGYRIVDPEEPLRIDGGNVLRDTADRLLIGVVGEPTIAFVSTVRYLENVTDCLAYRVPIAGGRFPHIDMALADLNGRAWLVYPNALPGFDPTDDAWRELLLGRPVIIADAADGERLACNLLVHDDCAIGPMISGGLRRQIERHGLRYVGTPLSELRKAGGGARCLTLELPALTPA